MKIQEKHNFESQPFFSEFGNFLFSFISSYLVTLHIRYYVICECSLIGHESCCADSATNHPTCLFIHEVHAIKISRKSICSCARKCSICAHTTVRNCRSVRRLLMQYVVSETLKNPRIFFAKNILRGKLLNRLGILSESDLAPLSVTPYLISDDLPVL